MSAGSSGPSVGGRASALAVIRRGLGAAPGFTRALFALVGVGVFGAIGRVAVPVLFQQILDRGITEAGADTAFLARSLLTATLVIVAVSAAAFTADALLVRFAERALADLRVRLLRKSLDLSLAEHADERRGDLVARITGDVDMITRFIDWGAYTWIVNGALIVLSAFVMALYSWQLCLIALVVLVSIVVPVRWLQRRQFAAYDRVRARNGLLLGEASETLGGIDVVRALGHRHAALERLDREIDEVVDAQLGANRYMAALFAVPDVFGAVAIAAVVAAAAIWGPGWGLELGEVVAVVFLVNLTLAPISELSEVLDQTALAVASWRRTLDLLDRPVVLPEPRPGRVLPPGPLAIDFDGVSFGYDGHRVLHDVELHVDAGTSVAVVGATGSGKTTFVRLLCRLADPDAGTVRLGGVDLREVAGDERRRRIRMVPQDGFLFATTVRDNILRGREGADDDDIAAAVERLGLGDWLASLPRGLDTELGPRGQGLSVGERQLVALVRAQLADPGLLVLDEATSSLDPVTERAMTDALDRIARERTTVSVAHRLATAERADLVLVFDAGRLVESGSHDELLTAGGHYARLHAAWRRGTATA
ncbi:MAG: ABC transporter ATP-binding protein [Actinomyces sp.]|nr:MAG: ABC transporter ATP-binding protein [Actinomyces sp.]